MINWEDANCKISKYFTVHECLWLPRWKKHADAADGLSDEVCFNLIHLCERLDKVREFIGAAMIVHSMYRPKEYNSYVLGTPYSAHTRGEACDFHVNNMDCDEAREKFLPNLDYWDMRMEDIPGANWIHLDVSPVIHKRYFKP